MIWICHPVHVRAVHNHHWLVSRFNLHVTQRQNSLRVGAEATRLPLEVVSDGFPPIKSGIRNANSPGVERMRVAEAAYHQPMTSIVA